MRIINLQHHKIKTLHFWGGLHVWSRLYGSSSLAVALSLPTAFADRELLQVMTFGIVLFTILVQGTTMQFLVRRVGIGQQPQLELEYERRHGRLLAARAAQKRVAEMHREGVISDATREELEPILEDEVENHLELQHQLIRAYPELQS